MTSRYGYGFPGKRSDCESKLPSSAKPDEPRSADVDARTNDLDQSQHCNHRI